jgi:hypothetical protein
MAVPLKDFRLGINETIDIMLDAEAIAFNSDKAAIAREVLKEWAKKKAHAYKVMQRRFEANGMQPELFGDETADDGVKRK